LERIEAPCVIGGSLASSSRGVWRATDPEACEAIRVGPTFNLSHIPTSYKFDISPVLSAFMTANSGAPK
jgi:hypothetical protein